MRPEPPGWNDFYESHSEPLQHWYGDIGLATSEDGGAILVWSQARDRIGLFARRFTSTDETADVGPGPATVRLHDVRFVPGTGVRALVHLPPTVSARLDLFDVGGRRLAARAIAATGGAAEVLLEGTEALGSGLYFARLIAAGEVATGRVVVTR